MNFKNGYYLIIFVFVFTGCDTEFKKNKRFILSDGTYIISSFINKHYSIQLVQNKSDSLNYIVQGKKNSISNQLWEIEHINGKNYKFKSLVNKQYLTVIKENNVHLTTSINLDGDDAQIWIIHKFMNDKFKILNKKYLNCIYISNLEKDSSLILQRKCNNNTDEFWTFEMIQD